MSKETVLKICILNGPVYSAKNWLTFLIEFNIYTQVQQRDIYHIKDLNNN